MQIDSNEAIARQYASEPLFLSAHSAVVFAFNFSTDFYDRPVMNKMADHPRPTGKGLSGLDGAAQAGFIRAELKGMGAVGEAIVVARVAPRSSPCACRHACCSGQILNTEWSNAIDVLVQHSILALSGSISNYRLRKAIVLRFFGEKIGFADIALKIGVSKTTANDQNQKIVKALKSEEGAVWSKLECRLIETGMVGSP